MKFLIPVMFFSCAAFAQMPKMPSTSDLKDISKKALEACKEDKSKISGCESYTDVKELKTCLMKNEAKLSPKCKDSLKLVK
jgi:hypothetical protein